MLAEVCQVGRGAVLSGAKLSAKNAACTVLLGQVSGALAFQRYHRAAAV